MNRGRFLYSERESPEFMLFCLEHGERDDLTLFLFLKVRKLWDGRWIIKRQTYCDEENCGAPLILQWF